MIESEGTTLLVDDEEEVRGILAETLKNAGYLVCDAGNYYEALEVLDWLTHVDLIANVSLPGTNGCELALWVPRKTTKGRVYFISGYSLPVVQAVRYEIL